jgi:hypothetical protein
MKLLITQSSPAPAISSLLGPNILLHDLFSNTLHVLLSQYERPTSTPMQNKTVKL